MINSLTSKIIVNNWKMVVTITRIERTPRKAQKKRRAQKVISITESLKCGWLILVAEPLFNTLV